MFDSLEKFETIEEMIKALGVCSYCKKECQQSDTLHSKTSFFMCKDDFHHYESRLRKYKYARKTYYRLTRERLYVENLHIFLSRDQEWNRFSRRVKTIIKLSLKHKGGTVKSYSPAKFKKLFKPQDTEHFMKKLESISKAVLLMG